MEHHGILERIYVVFSEINHAQVSHEFSGCTLCTQHEGYCNDKWPVPQVRFLGGFKPLSF